MQKNISVKIAILSISIFLMSHLAIAPAIPKLFEIYSKTNNVGLTSVESLVTIPALMITIFVLVSNFIIKFLGKKNTILLGLIFICISGIVPFFITNFKIVLICRLLLGIGIGLYNSISISIISDYYEDNERATMIGLRTAFLNIGKALTTFIAGYALLLGANYTYLVYLLVIPVLIFFYLNIDNKKDIATPLKSYFTFDKNVAILMIITFFVGISYIGATIKIPTLLIKHYNMSTIFSSNLLSILALSGIISGFIFGQLVKKINYKVMIFMIVLMLLGNSIFIISNNSILMYIASIFIGASFVGIMSSIFFYISKNYKKEQINFVTSMAIVAGNIGVILTPVILTKIPEKLNLELFITPFYITSVIMIINIGLYFLLNKK